MTNDPALEKDNLHRGDLFALKKNPDMTPEQAETWRAGLKFAVVVDPKEANRYSNQMCLLTAVNLAWRISGRFGSVTVHGVSDQSCDTMVARDKSLATYVTELGGECSSSQPGDDRLVILVGAAGTSGGRFQVRAVFTDWIGGIVPEDRSPMSSVGGSLPLGPALAASMAVWECFRFYENHGSAIGHISKGIDLWTMRLAPLADLQDEPATTIVLPNKLWCVGLGHLGQAYLWLISHLPYSENVRRALEVKLQDIDCVSRSNLSTSVLSFDNTIGRLKRDVCASWLLQRSFSPHLIEGVVDVPRRHDLGSDVVLGGVDNFEARRAIMASKPFHYIDAGLGSGVDDFQTMKILVPSNEKVPTDIWPARRDHDDGELRPSIRRLQEAGRLDKCGAVILNGAAVGFPFVGMCAATLVMAQLLSHQNGGQVFREINFDLTEPEGLSAK